MAKNKNKQSREISNALQGLIKPELMRERNNGLTDIAIGLQTQQNQLSQAKTVDVNLRRYLISNQRSLLSSLYVEVGIIQTLIDQPVNDAYAKMPTIKTGELEQDEINDVDQFIQKNGWFQTFKQALKWGRLFGGAGIFINTPQNPESPLNLDVLKKNDKVSLYACDRWELNYMPEDKTIGYKEPTDKVPYNINGQPVHKTRVLPIYGKEAPYLQRMQLMGWGMSEIERVIRDLNQFLKNQDVIFELIDEAKVDVYRLEGLKNACMSSAGTESVYKQVQLSNKIKNYLNALVLDKEDEFEQKTQTFSGLAEMNVQNKENLAGATKIPLYKLFGLQSKGFSGDESSIENYNSLLEGDVRSGSIDHYVKLWKIACVIVHGYCPQDVSYELPSLRILSAKEEEEVKTAKYNRLLQALQINAITEEQFIDACNKDNLLPINIEYDTALKQVEQEQKVTSMDGTEEEKNNSKWWKR